MKRFRDSCGQSLQERRTPFLTTTGGGTMYDFAVVVLLALAALKLVDFLTNAVPQVQPMRSLLTFVVAVGGTVLLDYSVFRAWGIDIRNATVGTWSTGFIVAGLTVPWRALFAFFTHDRATGD